MASGESGRIWSAGCSDGREPYTIACTLLQSVPDVARRNVKILASDVDHRSLARAMAGFYGSDLVDRMPRDVLDRFFNRAADGVEAGPELKALIAFRYLNLLADWPFKQRFDIIFCRNVLIYFEQELQAEIISRFCSVLKPGGYLYIGHSERVSGAAVSPAPPGGCDHLQARTSRRTRVTARTIVVDDSPSMQALIAAVLQTDPEIEVVGTAENPEEARQLIKALNPDVITLDIEMPGMNGLEFLERLMRLRPMPVVMISSWTRKGADATIAALELGAFSCLPKPRMDDEAALRDMCENVKAAAAARHTISQRGKAPSAAPARSSGPNVSPRLDIVAVGASTGGVEALTELLSGFPEQCPPTVITQHMPEHFTKSFSQRLDRLCPPTVVEAEDMMPLQRGHVYLAPGGIGHLTVSDRADARCWIRRGEPVSGHMPSVDVMFESVAKVYGRRSAAALLTGMGSDGANGMLALKDTGAHTIAQDRDTSLVFGMPAAAARLGAANHVLPLSEIAAVLLAGPTEVRQSVCA